MELVNDRQNHIVRQLIEKGSVKVSDLSKQLSVSETTIRKDLLMLEKDNKLVRVHGGAHIVETDIALMDMHNYPNRNLKMCVAKSVVDLINEGDIIFLGSGTTCIEISQHLKYSHKNLTIISNNFSVVSNLSDVESFTVLCTGGRIESHGYFKVLHGDFVVQNLEGIFVQKSIMTSDGVSLSKGYTTYNRDEYYLFQTIKKISDKIVFAVDSTKFDNISLLPLANIEEIDTVVTDDNIPDDYRRYYEKNGVSLYIGSRD